MQMEQRVGKQKDKKSILKLMSEESFLMKGQACKATPEGHKELEEPR